MMILRPVRPAVAHRAADLEAAGRVHQEAVALGVQLDAVLDELREHVLDDELADVGCEQRVQVDVRGMLRGDDHRVQPDRLVTVVLDGDLGLAVGAQVGDGPVLAHLGQSPGEAVRDVDRERHQLRRLVAGVAEHQALVARALLVELVLVALDPLLVRGVDALCDVRRLRADRHRDATGSTVEALFGGVVTDLQNLVAHEVGDVGVGLGGDLARDMHQTGGDQGLDGDARGGVLAQERVENRVADLVSDLVGVTLGDRFRGEETAGHIAPWGCSGCWLIMGGTTESCARRVPSASLSVASGDRGRCLALWEVRDVRHAGLQ